jgi:hypothetical protein
MNKLITKNTKKMMLKKIDGVTWVFFAIMVIAIIMIITALMLPYNQF